MMRSILVLVAVAVGLSVAVPAMAAPKLEEMLAKVEAALPAKTPAVPAKPRKLLVYSKTLGYRHSSIPIGAKAIELMGTKTGAYETTATEDNAFFEPEKLSAFDAVLMLSTTGELFEAGKPKKAAATGPADATLAEKLAAPVADDAATTQRLRKSLLAFVAGGKGLVGIHAATDCSYKWADYGTMIGGYFNKHPWHEKMTVLVEDPAHPCCRHFGAETFQIVDEIYQFKEPYSRDKQRVLLSILSSEKDPELKKGARADHDYPVTWVKTYEKGRVFYCSLGHREEVYWNPQILAHYLAGIQFAMGDLPAETVPTGRKPPTTQPVTPPAAKADGKQ